MERSYRRRKTRQRHRRERSTPLAWSSCLAALTCTATSPALKSMRAQHAPGGKRRSPVVKRTKHTHSGTLGSVPSTFATGYKYVGLGYTTAFDAAVPPLAARHAHEEFDDTPCIDKGFYVLMGNNHYIMEAIREQDPERLQAFVGWLLGAAKGYAVKLVNPGGVEVWKHHAAGNVTVVKRTVGGDGTFGFSGDLGSFDLTTTAGVAQRVFADLAAGTYAVSETVPAGWDLTGATCSDGSDPSAINLAAGENVTCSFENVNRGGLIVVKQARVGDDARSPLRARRWAASTVTTSGGTGQQAFPNLVPGTYDVAETIPAGWRLESATCSDGSDPANVAVDPGENVTCTFTNTKLDTIVIVKRAVGGDDVFTFTSADAGRLRS